MVREKGEGGGEDGTRLTPILGAVAIQRIVFRRTHILRAIEAIVNHLEMAFGLEGNIG